MKALTDLSAEELLQLLFLTLVLWALIGTKFRTFTYWPFKKTPRYSPRDKQDIEQRAKRSKSLLENEWFLETIKDLRDTQMRTFADSSAQEVEKREDAHAILRALTAIERSLQADVDAVALIQRKGKHRGND